MSLSHAQEEWRGEVIHLSWSPRAFLLKGFLTDEECDHIIEKVRHACCAGCSMGMAVDGMAVRACRRAHPRSAQRSMLSTLPCPAHRLPSHHLCHCSQQAKPHMEASMVADNESGAAVASKVRTSTGTFFALGDDEIITRIEKRVAQVSMIPVSECGEG